MARQSCNCAGVERAHRGETGERVIKVGRFADGCIVTIITIITFIITIIIIVDIIRKGSRYQIG